LSKAGKEKRGGGDIYLDYTYKKTKNKTLTAAGDFGGAEDSSSAAFFFGVAALAVAFLGVATLAAAAFLVERGAGLSGNAIISASYHGPTRRDGKKIKKIKKIE
jgi:hypothetical protein